MIREIILILTQFGAGPGDPANAVVRFLLPSAFWIVLIAISWSQWRWNGERRDLYIAAASLVGLSRELFMLVSEYGSFRGYLTYERFFNYYPPFEHAATMASIILVAYAFLRYYLRWERFSRVYLIGALGWTALLWLVLSPLWMQFLADNLAATGTAPLFGSFWGDMVFRVSAVVIFSVHLGGFIQGRRKGLHIPGALFAAFIFFWLDEFLMIINLAQREAHIEYYAALRHNLHIWGVALLLGVYWWDQKNRILELEDARLRNAELLEYAPVLVRNLDDEIILWNSGMETLYGWPRSEAVGKVTHDLLRTEHPVPLSKIKAIQQREGRWEGELRHIRSDGTPIFVKSLQVLHRDATGTPSAIIEVNSDITGLKRAKDELRQTKDLLERQNEELRTLDRMKDGFIRDVSHEMKTPVAKHAMQLELLRDILDRHGLRQETESILSVMDTALKRQGDTIRNLLDISRLEGGGRKYRREPVRLKELVLEVVDDYRFNISRHEIEVRSDLQDVMVESDGDMLRHVLSNVINNAIKFRRQVDPLIDISLAQDPDGIQIVVGDNGIGLTEQDKAGIFVKFYQGSSTVEGSGVGLNICKIIIEDLGGTIALHSDGPGRGTTVRIRLPLARPDRRRS